MKENYMNSDTYREHCMNEFISFIGEDFESRFEDFIAVEFNKSADLDILLQYDVWLDILQEGIFKDCVKKYRTQFIDELPLGLDEKEIAELFKEYKRYYIEG